MTQYRMTSTGRMGYREITDRTGTWTAPDIQLITNLKVLIDFKVDRFWAKRGIKRVPFNKTKKLTE